MSSKGSQRDGLPVPPRTTGPLKLYPLKAQNRLSGMEARSSSKYSDRSISQSRDSNLESFYGNILDSVVYRNENGEEERLDGSENSDNTKSKVKGPQSISSKLNVSLDPLTYLKNSNSPNASDIRDVSAHEIDNLNTDHHYQSDYEKAEMRDTALEVLDGAAQRRRLSVKSENMSTHRNQPVPIPSKREKRINILSQMRKQNQLALRRAESSPLPPIITRFSTTTSTNQPTSAEDAISPGLYDLQTCRNTELNANIVPYSTEYSGNIDALDLNSLRADRDTRVNFSQDVLCYSIPPSLSSVADQKDSSEPSTPSHSKQLIIIPLAREEAGGDINRPFSSALNVHPAPAQKRTSSLYYNIKKPDGRPLSITADEGSPSQVASPRRLDTKHPSDVHTPHPEQQTSTDYRNSVLGQKQLSRMAAQRDYRMDLDSLGIPVPRFNNAKDAPRNDVGSAAAESPSLPPESTAKVIPQKTDIARRNSMVGKSRGSGRPEKPAVKDETAGEEPPEEGPHPKESDNRASPVLPPQASKVDIYQDLLLRYLNSGGAQDSAQSRSPSSGGADLTKAPHKPSPAPSFYSPLPTNLRDENTAIKSSPLSRKTYDPTIKLHESLNYSTDDIMNNYYDEKLDGNSAPPGDEPSSNPAPAYSDKKLQTDPANLRHTGARGVSTADKSTQTANANMSVSAAVQTVRSSWDDKGIEAAEEQVAIQKKIGDEYERMVSLYEDHIAMVEEKISSIDSGLAEKSRARLNAALGTRDAYLDAKTKDFVEYDITPALKKKEPSGDTPSNAASNPELLLDTCVTSYWENFARAEFVFLENTFDSKSPQSPLWRLDAHPPAYDNFLNNKEGASIALRAKYRICEAQETLLSRQVIYIEECLRSRPQK